MTTKYIALALLVCLCAVGQDTTVKVTGKGPQSSGAAVTIVHKSALVTYGIGSATINGAGLASVPIAINSKTGQLPAALQFDLSWTASEVSGVSFTVGPAATAANKTIQCASQGASSARCVISGGILGIGDGVVALASVQTILTSQATTSLVLFSNISASIGATAITTVVAPGGGVIAMPALLASVSCSQPDIWQGLTVPCSVALNKPAPSGGISVALSADSALVSAPASVQIAAGATSGSFSLTGM